MKLKLDLHIHSERSPDGRMTLSEIVERAKAAGLDGVAVCDHDAVLENRAGISGFPADPRRGGLHGAGPPPGPVRPGAHRNKGLRRGGGSHPCPGGALPCWPTPLSTAGTRSACCPCCPLLDGGGGLEQPGGPEDPRRQRPGGGFCRSPRPAPLRRQRRPRAPGDRPRRHGGGSGEKDPAGGEGSAAFRKGGGLRLPQPGLGHRPQPADKAKKDPCWCGGLRQMGGFRRQVPPAGSHEKRGMNPCR